MAIDLPLDTMSLADKLETMEALWADLSKEPSKLPSPAWHQTVLNERRVSVAAGELRFLDWENAITELRQDLHENPPA